MKKILLFTFFAFFPFSGIASAPNTLLHLNFEQGVTDDGPNAYAFSAVGSLTYGGNSNVTAQLGSYWMGPCTDSNYVSSSAAFNTAFSTASNSRYAIEFRMFATSNTTGPIPVSWSDGTGQNWSYFRFLSNGNLLWEIGASGISSDLTLNPNATSPTLPNVFPNNWINVALEYTGSGRKIYIDGVQWASCSNCGGPMANISKFYIGKYADSNGFAFTGYLDDFRVLTTNGTYPTHDLNPPTSNHNILLMGDSIGQGTTCSGSVAALGGDGYRSQMDSWISSIGYGHTFLGNLAQGTISWPRTASIAGYLSANMLADLPTRLIQQFPIPNSTDMIILGPGVRNDAAHAVSVVTTKSNYDAMATDIFNYSPSITMFFVTTCLSTDGIDVTPYNTKVRLAYATAISAGYKAKLIDLEPLTIPLCDGVHPNDAGYVVIGNAIGKALTNAFSKPSTRGGLMSFERAFFLGQN